MMFCHFGGCGVIAGVLPVTRAYIRTITSTNTDSPSMKCHILNPSRISLPFG